jgi:hypothetical protein
MQQSQEGEGHPGRRMCEQWVGDEAESYLWALGSGIGGWCSCCSESQRPRARRKAGWVVSWELGREGIRALQVGWRRSWYFRQSFAGSSSAPLSPGLGGKNGALREEGKGSHSGGITAHGPWGPPEPRLWLCESWFYGSFWSRSQCVRATSGRALHIPRPPRESCVGEGG